jgi:hypothetical protein
MHGRFDRSGTYIPLIFKVEDRCMACGGGGWRIVLFVRQRNAPPQALPRKKFLGRAAHAISAHHAEHHAGPNGD